jgi:ABC-type branched-subunit amino acid transport system ATPase component
MKPSRETNPIETETPDIAYERRERLQELFPDIFTEGKVECAKLKAAIGELADELAEAGVAVLLSTHDLATAEAVAQRAGIIHRGQLLAEGSAAELRALASAPDLETVFLTLTGEEERQVA